MKKTLKKRLKGIIVLGFVAMAFTGCNSSNNNESQPSAALLSNGWTPSNISQAIATCTQDGYTSGRCQCAINIFGAQVPASAFLNSQLTNQDVTDVENALNSSQCANL